MSTIETCVDTCTLLVPVVADRILTRSRSRAKGCYKYDGRLQFRSRLNHDHDHHDDDDDDDDDHGRSVARRARGDFSAQSQRSRRSSGSW